MRALRGNALILDCLKRCSDIITPVVVPYPAVFYARESSQALIGWQHRIRHGHLHHATPVLLQGLVQHCTVQRGSTILDDSSRPSVLSSTHLWNREMTRQVGFPEMRKKVTVSGTLQPKKPAGSKGGTFMQTEIAHVGVASVSEVHSSAEWSELFTATYWAMQERENGGIKKWDRYERIRVRRGSGKTSTERRRRCDLFRALVPTSTYSVKEGSESRQANARSKWRRE